MIDGLPYQFLFPKRTSSIASCSKNEAHERVLNGPHKWKKSMHSTELSAMSFESVRVMFAVVLMKLPKTTRRKKEHGPMIAD